MAETLSREIWKPLHSVFISILHSVQFLLIFFFFFFFGIGVLYKGAESNVLKTPTMSQIYVLFSVRPSIHPFA